jgi:hypothetical protein
MPDTELCERSMTGNCSGVAEWREDPVQRELNGVETSTLLCDAHERDRAMEV